MRNSRKSNLGNQEVSEYLGQILKAVSKLIAFLPKRLLSFWALLLFLGFAQQQADAQTYTISSPKYSGGTINNNTGCAPGAKCASYTGTMSITGSITFSQLLGPNLNGASATIVSYNVSDGVNTFNTQNSFIDRAVFVTTNANGNLVSLETLFRQWQNPNQNTTNSFLNELWLTPNFYYIFNAVRCGSQGAPGGCFQAFYESGFSSYINLQPNLMPTYRATNADLSGIAVVAVATGESSAAPNFSANQLAHSVTVPFQTSQIRIRPTALHGSASIMVNGTSVVSGSNTGILNLARGVNTFTITVTAQDGFTKKSYTLSVTRSDPSTDANLSAASISPGTLNQTFSPQTLNYTATVPFSQTTVHITATRAQNFANIALNGVAMSSGVQSNLLPLSVGQNTFNVVVTAEDGQTKKTYVLTIQRQNPSTNAILDFLSFNPDVTITPDFLPSQKTYSATVPFSMAKIKFVPTSQDPNATVTVRGITVARGVASGDINLGQGNNIIPVIVTAQDGTTRDTYTVTITRQAPSTNADLANLLVNNSAFNQTFSPSTTSYSLTVPFRSTTATFGIQTADENATVTVNGRATPNSGVSAPVALNVGSNTIQIRVVAENGTTVKTTTVTLTREAAATNPALSQLTVNTGSLTGPVIENNIYKYTASNVLFAVTSVTVTPTATDGVKTNISVNGRAVASGSASTPINLVVGTNVIKIITTAESGATREHWITITRSQPSGVNDLQSLSLASGTLSPSFSANQLEYTATVADNVSSLAITPVLLNATASIRINGISSANNTARSVNLSFGSNEISIAVRAENGATKTYKVIVTRSLSANSALSGIGMSAGTLSPTFASGTTAYTSTVNFSVATLLLSPQKANEYASVKINNEPVASSKNMSLAVGVNTFTILVTAQNGSATTTYTVQVTRQAASTVSSLASVSLSSGTVAGFTAATTTYNNITSTTSTIKVTASPTDANATLKVNGKTTPNGTASGLIPLVSGVVVPVLVEVTAQDGSTRTTYTLNVTFTPPACSPTETTITENGKNYKVLRFSTVGDCQWQAPAGVDKIDYLVVGGGGGTAGSTSGNTAWGNFIGGGGGGGGVLGASNYQITPRQSYNIKVGAGGNGGTKSNDANTRKASNGIDSQFGSLLAKGGGAGGSLAERGLAGGAGGGGGGKSLSLGGNGTSGQGFSGGAASWNIDLFAPNKAAGGGGGGAGGTGASADGPKKAGNGGRGILSSITGTATYYGGGGGGGSRDFQCAGGFLWLSRVDCGVTQGAAGQGGGVAGKQSGNGNHGVDGLGGGAGGIGGDGAGGTGGDGVVVLRYELSPCLPTLTTIVGNITNGVFTADPAGTAYNVLTFNNLGTCSTWTPPVGVTSVDYLVVGGGGSGGTPGGSAGENYWGTGGGGAGGLLEGSLVVANGTTYTITVGAGGVAPTYSASTTSTGLNGGNSVFAAVTAFGGGGGGAGVNVDFGRGKDGGSGGGNGGDGGNRGGNYQIVGQGSSGQGFNGALARTQAGDRTAGGGGGGATAAGSRGGGSNGDAASPGGAGGAGKSSTITGTAITYAGGGGGGSRDTNSGANQSGGAGGIGGGGNGDRLNPGNGTNGLGGGGGGVGADNKGGNGGSGVVILRYAVSTDANLTALSVGQGTLSPVFASATTTYSLTVPNGTDSLTITPVASHPDALININGGAVESGKSSAVLDVEVGDNTFSVVVTAPDGRTRKTYTINVRRTASNANLMDLFTSEGGISPSFHADTLRYDVPVSGTITSVKLAARTQHANATLKINGVTVANGQYSSSLNLPNFGANSFPVVVTAEDGVTTKTYTVVVSRVSVVLTNLSSSTGQIQETFDSSRKTYTQTVANAVKSLGLLPVALDPNAVIRINGQTVRSGATSPLFDLEVGSNTLTVDVVAVDGSASDKYTLAVTRGAPAAETRLQNLAFSSGTLAQTFASDTKTYTMSVPFASDTTSITATALDPNATLVINGEPAVSGVQSNAVRLQQGQNTIRVDVTAQNGIAQDSYTVTITRGAPTSEDKLSALVVSDATLSPMFGENTFAYTSSVNFSVSSVTVTATAKDANASIRVNGETLKSGAASQPISLVQGSNTIQVEVFGQDGSNLTQPYVLTITRGTPSSVATLSAIGISSGTLSPSFSSATTSYTTTQTFVTEAITLSATPTNANATITINGESVSSGHMSSLLALTAGAATTYQILVTAENGTTTSTYSVAATRSVASTSDLLSGLTHTGGALNETFSSTTYLYTSTVPFATTSTRIAPVLSDTKAQVKVNGVIVASGQQSAELTLAQGLNEFTIETQSESQTSTKTYVLRITRSAPATNADLSALTLAGITFTPSYTANTTSYAATVANTLASTRATATLADPTASLRINGLATASGQAGEVVALSPGSNVVEVVVTAQDGTTQKTYQVTLTKQFAPPQLDVNTVLILAEGQVGTISRGNLLAIDQETASAGLLTYVATSLPQNGTLFIDQNGSGTLNSGEEVVLNGSFTQQQVDEGLILYVHSGSETTSDSFNFTLSDPDGGSVTGTHSFQITPVNDLPVGSNLSLGGLAQVGSTLTATYTYTDAESQVESGTTYNWYKVDDQQRTNPQLLATTSTNQYVLTTADVNTYLYVEVTPKDGVDFGLPINSTVVGLVSDKPTVTTLAAVNILSTQADLKGIISNENSSTVTRAGFVYSLATSPTLGDPNSTDASVTVGINSELTKQLTLLTPGTTYYYRFYAENARGVRYGSELSFTTPTVPAAPTALVATPENGQITIAFTAGANGGAAITNYEYTLDGTTWIAFSPAVTASPVTVTDLTGGISYTIRLRAVNFVGPSLASASVTAVPFAVPGAPTSLVATPGNGQATIAFTAGSNGGSAIVNYQYSLDGTTWTALNPATSSFPVTITGLTNGTLYTIKLRAVNGTGTGLSSTAVTVTPFSTPSAPASLSGTAGNGQATIAFTVGGNGGSAITNYEYSLDGSTWTALNPTVTSSPLTITGLTNGTSYTVQIRAMNAAGSGTASSSVTVIPSTSPAAPTSLVATAGNGQATIAFTAGGNGGSAITNYEYSLDGTTWTAFNPANSSSPVTITGLTNGTLYTIKLRAVNGIGTGVASAAVTVTPFTTPSAPTSLSATAGNGQVTLAFTAGATGGSAITNYEYSLDGTTWTAFNPSVTSSPLTITGLTNGTSYPVQIRAVNVAGSGTASSSVTVIPSTIPAAPSSLVATPGNGQATIAFTAGSNGGSAIVNYQYSLDGTTWTAFNPANSSSPVTITGLTNGTLYTIKLRAVNGIGTGVASAAVTVTPFTTPSAPTSLSATAGNGQATIAFTPGGTGGSAITNYEYSLNGTNWTVFNPAVTSSPLTITGLTNGTSYPVQIRAVNVAGSGTASSSVTVIPSTIPAAPSSLVATPGNGQATIAFTAGSNGGSAIVNYQYSLDGTTWTAFNPANSSSPVTITGLTNGTLYTIKLRAVNGIGTGVASAAVSITPVNPLKPLTSASITVDPIPVQTYSGLAKNPAVVVKDGSTTLTLGTDYAVAYSNNTNAGTATATLTGLGSYTGTKVQTFTIGKASLSVRVVNVSKNFGQTDPANSVTYVGFVNNEVASSLTGILTYSRAAGELPGNYAITATGLTSTNYTLTFVGGILTINSIDSDGDGVPNHVEQQQGTNPNDGNDALDSDGDGVPDYIETQQGTNPNNANDAFDSDGDGVPNYIETQQGTNPNNANDPLDSDGDGVPDYIEEQQGTDPNEAGDATDSDGDGVPDYIEIQQGTNPNNSNDATDSDGDGVPDYVEEQQGTDPNESGDAVDSDGDGVPDFIEIQQGTDPTKSNDTKDSDGDGVPDYIEIQQGTNPNNSNDAKDTDGDGVPDYVELAQGTDPKNASDNKDTDGDGVPDYVEIQQGTNPNNATDVKDADKDGVADHIQSRSIKLTKKEDLVLVWGDKNYRSALPKAVEVTLFSGAKSTVEVVWNKPETVNTFKRGSYELTGTLVLANGMYNPYKVNGQVRVVVLPKPAPRDVTIDNSTFEGSTTVFFIGVGAFQVNDPVDNIHVVSFLGDGYDNKFFFIKDNVLYWNSAERAPGKVTFSIVVRVTDRDGNTLDKFFTINRTRKDFSSLTITNAYSPNGDGANDTWGVPELRFYEGVRIQIYNSGGSRLFYTENPDIRWDGTYNGKDMPVGTYYWVIEVIETGEMRRGMLNLIRK